MSIFLHGGGGDVASFRPFTELCSKIALIAYVDDGDNSVYEEILEILKQAGAKAIQAFAISKTSPLDMAALQSFQPDGIFVCGGVTPDYHAALCENPAFGNYLLQTQLPYCGTSAGAMIASQRAILGGWRREWEQHSTQILFQGASEGLEPITVKAGLGLVDVAIDVHASQWGTLSRLVHTVDSGLAQSGYAIDENTVLIWPEMRVAGLGQVYHVNKAEKGVSVEIIHA